MGTPHFHERPPGVRISESVPSSPSVLYIGGLVQRLEREQRDWRKQWNHKSTAGVGKLHAQFEFWNIDRQLKKLRARWDRGTQTIAKSDYRKMKLAGMDYVTACLNEHNKKTEARIAAIDLARKNAELAEAHHQRDLARARLGK